MFNDDFKEEKIRRLAIDLRVREQRLQELKSNGGKREEILVFEDEVANLGQALNLLSGPCCRNIQKNNYFFNL